MRRDLYRNLPAAEDGWAVSRDFSLWHDLHTHWLLLSLPPPPPPPPSAFLQAAPERASSLATDSADSSSESGASSTSSMTNTSAPAVHLVPSVPRLRHCRPLAARPIVATVPVPRSPSYITMKEALARTQRALQAAEQERDELLACVRELEAERSWSASESYDSCLNLKVMV